MKKEEILKKVDCLYNMYHEGKLGGEIMPEDENPRLEKTSKENYLYFTLPMALNYQRNSYTLWENANKTYQDKETHFVFEPQEVLKRPLEEVQMALTKYKVALQKNKQTEIWITLCQTIEDLFDGDIRKLFIELENDVDKIRNFIQKEKKKRFPYLSGTKICNYWLYVIWQYTKQEYKNIENLTVAPDTHVVKATHRLGLITEKELTSSNVQEIVINRWNELLKGTKYKPIDIHTPLWLWSRNGFKELENEHIFDKISSTCSYVIEKSKDVTINYVKIDELLKNDIPRGKHWGESNAFGFMDHDIRKIVNFLLLYQSICFSFWGENKWSIKTDNYGLLDGSQALMYIFMNNLDFFTDFKQLQNMSFKKYKTMMQGNYELPLLKERYEILISIAKVVNEKMNGDFYNYIKDVKDDRILFNIIIDNFQEFKDERTYEGKTIYFYKLASLLTSDIMHARNLKEKEKYDFSHIVGCSDYKIPQILRDLGLTTYSEELANLVDNKIELNYNSSYEVEIRAATIVIINYIKSKKNLCGMEINDFLWLESQKINSTKPYHRTRSTSY